MSIPSKNLPDIITFYFLGASLLGLWLLATSTFTVSTFVLTFRWQKQLVGSIFGGICLLGMIMSISPSRCSGMLHFRSQDKSPYKKNRTFNREAKMSFKGHHPQCGRFFRHILRLGGRTYCAGCTGLFIGAVTSFSGSLLYFFAGIYVEPVSIMVFWLGFGCVAGGLLQYHLLNIGGGLFHLFLNVIFVLGAFLLMVGLDELTGNLVLELYLLALIVFWILARVILSQLGHRKICASCSIKSCGFYFN